MATHSIGRIFVELDLDPSRYTRAQQTLLKEAQHGATILEKNFKNLGIKSGATFDLMRARAVKAFETIKKSGRATTDDLIRAEKAKAEKIKRINDQQYGHTASIFDKIKKHWMATTAAIVAAWYAVGGAIRKGSEVVLAAARYETLGVSMRVVGNNAGYTYQELTELQGELEKTGISMRGSRQSIIKMAQAQLDLSKATELARGAQHAAVIGAMDSTEAFNQMVYGIQSANVRVLRTIGINVSFEDSYKKLEKQLGRSKETFTQAEKAGARLGVTLEALTRLSGTYEAAMETAGKQLLSLNRHFDNLKVKAGAAFTPALLEAVQTITGDIKDLNKELSGESTQKIHEWGVNFRIVLIDIKIELMNVALLLDKIGGTMTTVMVGLFSFGNAIGNENSQKQYTEWMKKNIEYKKRYWQTVIDIVELEEKQLALEYSLTDAGKAQAKAKLEALENVRLAASAAAKALEDQRVAEERTAEAATKHVKELDKEIKKVNKELEAYYKNLEKTKENLNKFFRVELIADPVMKSVEQLKIKFEELEKQIYETFVGDDLKANLENLSEWYDLEIDEILNKTSDAFKEISEEIENLDFQGTSFGNELADGINNAMISMQSLNDLFEKHAELQKNINKIQDEGLRKQAQAALDAKGADYFQAQISGYRQLFGTVSQLFKENSEEREALHKAEMAFAVVELAMSAKKMAMDAASTVMAIANSAKRCVAWGVEAVAAAVAGIAGQATGDPYTAFARVAAMIALMGSVLAMAGKAFGSGGSSGGYSGTAASTTGTVLGDPTKSSESLQSSLDMMKEYHAEDYRELVGIHNEMKDLNDNITGLVANIVRGFGDFEGGKFEYSAKGFFGKQSDAMIKVFDQITDAFTLPLDFGGKWINRIISRVTDLAGKIGDWVFGGKVKVKIKGAGIALGYDEKGKPQSTTVGDILAGDYPSVQAYYDIYKKTSGGLFGSTKRKRWTEFEEADADVTRLFNKIYENMANMLIALAEGFNFSAEQMAEVFVYEFAAAKLDLKGLTGAEITEKINAWLSTSGDEAAEALFGEFIAKYQEVDEGMLETAMRLLAQKEILFSVFEMINVAFDDTTTAAIDFSQAIIALATDFETLIEAIGKYYDAFFSEQEKFEDIIASLGKTLADIGYILPFTREGFRDLVEGLDLTTEEGKKAFVALMEAAEAFDAFYDYLEENMQTMSGEDFEAVLKALAKAMEEAGATADELAEALDNAFGLIRASIEDIIKRHEEYGKTDLETMYEKYPEWAEQFPDYDAWKAFYDDLQRQFEEESRIEREGPPLDFDTWLKERFSAEWFKDYQLFGEHLQDAWEDLQKAVEDNTDALDAYAKEQQAMIGELEQLVNAFTKAMQAITDYQETLLSTSGMLSPDVQYAQAGSQLTNVVQDLYSKDKETALAAVQNIPDYVSQFLEASKVFSATPEQYMADFARAMMVLNTAAEISANWASKIASQVASYGFSDEGGSDYGGATSSYDPSLQWGDPGYYYPMQQGGVISGPDSGYQAPITFHGTEHIVSGSQMGDVKKILGEVKEVLIQVRDTNGDQNKTSKKLYRIIDRVSQGEEYLMTKAV